MGISESKVYSQVNSVLSLLGEEYINRLPVQYLEFINMNKDDDYNPTYSLTQDIENQDISKKALSLITYFNLTYWCNEEERKELQDILNENEKQYKEMMKNKSSFEQLNESKSEEIKTEITDLVQKSNESFIVRIINKIKLFFKR